MKRILFLILTVISFLELRGQNEIIVDQAFNGNTSYGRHSIQIDSINQLAERIQMSINGYLSVRLGNLSSNVSFSHGQEVDLKSYFSGSNEPHKYKWIVPKYDLNFVLQDSSIGIKRYYLQMRFDEYGQLLSLNWPVKGYSDKSKFQSRNEIKAFATNHAQSRGYRTTEFSNDLKYNSKLEALCWVFKFPLTSKSSCEKFNVLEIDVSSLKVVDEYMITTSIVH